MQMTMFGTDRKVKGSSVAPGQGRLGFNPDNATMSAPRGEMTLRWIDGVLRGVSAYGAGPRHFPTMLELQSGWNEGLTIAQAIERHRPEPQAARVVTCVLFMPIEPSSWRPPVKHAWTGLLALPAPSPRPEGWDSVDTSTEDTAKPVRKPRKESPRKADVQEAKPVRKPRKESRELLFTGRNGKLETDGTKLRIEFTEYQDKTALRKVGIHHSATCAYNSQADWAERYTADDTAKNRKLAMLMMVRESSK